MTWSIVTTKENSSYITDYEIYLYPNFLKRIARKDHGIQFNITGLKPYSDYTVGIVALDGSSQQSVIRYSENFSTTEAGKYSVSYNNSLISIVNVSTIKKTEHAISLSMV